MTITKKNNKYYCRFQINGERHHYLCSGASSVAEATQMENAFKYKLQQQQNGVIPKEDKRVRLSNILDLFESYSKLNKKSYKSDSHMLTIIRAYFKNIMIQDITAKTLEDFKDYLINERELKNSTVNRYNSLLSKAFNLGIANRLIKENPVKFVGKLKEKNYKIRFLTKDEEKIDETPNILFKCMCESNDFYTFLEKCKENGITKKVLEGYLVADCCNNYGKTDKLCQHVHTPQGWPVSGKLHR